MHVADRTRKTVLGNIVKHVEPGTTVHTDEYRSYEGLSRRVFEHKAVNHAVRFVDGTVHTNNVENFWSMMKRCLKGTYISVEPFHLFRYLDEQAFRFNLRRHPDGDQRRFLAVVRRIVGRRLTYKQLIGENLSASPA